MFDYSLAIHFDNRFNKWLIIWYIYQTSEFLLVTFFCFSLIIFLILFPLKAEYQKYVRIFICFFNTYEYVFI